MHQSGSGNESFTAFHSAREEADMKTEKQVWENEGGHVTATEGRVMHAPDAVSLLAASAIPGASRQNIPSQRCERRKPSSKGRCPRRAPRFPRCTIGLHPTCKQIQHGRPMGRRARPSTSRKCERRHPRPFSWGFAALMSATRQSRRWVPPVPLPQTDVCSARQR